jgi:hypothetical protein
MPDNYGHWQKSLKALNSFHAVPGGAASRDRSYPRPESVSSVKARPMLFSAPMVRAILEGRKTVTRRVVKGGQIPTENLNEKGRLRWSAIGQKDPRYGFIVCGETAAECANELATFGRCPYGRPGERLWVRETWALLGNEDGACVDWNDNIVKGDESAAARIYKASCSVGEYGLWQIPDRAPWKPDTEGVQYEGAWRPSIHMFRWASRILLEITDVRVERLQDISEEQAQAEGVKGMPRCRSLYPTDDYRWPFKDLWNSINGASAWDANPWVWVVEFKRVTP